MRKFIIEFVNRSGHMQKTGVEAGSEYGARKAVAARPDCYAIFSCVEGEF